MTPALKETPALNLEEANRHLDGLDAHERIQWAHEIFGSKLVLSTSFGVQSAVLLHMANEAVPGIPVIWVDTGYHFPETYRFADELSERLKLNLKIYQPQMTAARQEALFGKRWEADKEALIQYNLQNKVEPMNRALTELGAEAWISGLRRSQSSTREGLHHLVKQNRTYKVHPILGWTDRDIYNYLTKHSLPYHPLWDEGYVSVGDWHSTSKLMEGMTAEQTRFGGVKRECGLHELSGNADWQI